jgi:hypothetical protein
MACNEGGLALLERHGFHREAVLAHHVRDGEGALQELVVLARELDRWRRLPAPARRPRAAAG